MGAIMGCIGGLLLALFVAVCHLFGEDPFRNPFATMTFDRIAWREDESCSDSGNRRGHMAYNILYHQLRVGQTESQIEQLLGFPEGVLDREVLRKDPTSNQQEVKALAYYLGEELGMMHGVDRAWLYLYFDKQNCYTRGYIWQPSKLLWRQ